MGCRALCLTLLFLLAGSYAQPPFHRLPGWGDMAAPWLSRMRGGNLQGWRDWDLHEGVYTRRCSLITPNVLRVESDETFVLDAQGHDAAFEAEIVIQDFPQKKLSLAQGKVSLNSGNGFLGTVTMKVPSKDLPRDAKNKQFVYVTVKSSACPLEKVVLLSFHSGYIFIQTDKTIYTPGSNVMYRLFIVGHSLAPDTRSADVELTNPDGIVVEKNLISSSDSSGIVSRTFTLPEIANVGTWQIVSRFQVAPQEIFRTEFEVKEYVLPSFEVKLDPAQNFFYVDDNEFSVDISARFLHGKPVDGSGYAMFGVIVNNEKRSFPDSLTKITVTEGSATVKLNRHMMLSRFPDPSLLLGYSLYVTVTVMTNAGSDLVEAERMGIPVVKTAFSLLFTKTSRYFKPGLPYTLKLTLLNHDGSPASGVSVRTVEGLSGVTGQDGSAQIIINTALGAETLPVKVRTEARSVPEHRQAAADILVQAYRPQGASGNYLHIGVTAAEVKPGDNLNVNFYISNKEPVTQNQIQHFTYLILSRGRILDVGRQARQQGQSLVTMSLVITETFIPSFRIVAYYMADREMVSDSVWVDVTDSCMGTLRLSQDPSSQIIDPTPGSALRMKVTGNPGAKVGLVAVDKAVFVLNKKNRMSQAKIWREVEQSDLGCTPGGGSDSAGVFTDAGLSVESNMGLGTPTRSEPRCTQVQRLRRAALITGPKAAKAQEYQDSRLRRCCEDGMQENPMGYSCQRRVRYVLDAGECAAAFLECCKFVHEPEKVVRGHRRKIKQFSMLNRVSAKGNEGLLGGPEEDPEYMSMSDIVSRSYFAESWLWKIETLPTLADRAGLSSKVVSTTLPDSITTWEFLAISLSPTAGICVADPYELLVKKLFFIDLRLPYSVVRNEQVEIRAVLYNYAPQDIKVRVDLLYNEKMCSSAPREGSFRQEVTLEKGATLVLPFVIVPLVVGEVLVEVKASVSNLAFSDGVKKKLKVVPEGIKIHKNIQSLILDPKRYESVPGVQIIYIDPVSLKDVVPNSDPVTYISVKGDLLGETLDNSIDGSNLNHLIMVPTGCGEQNMITMTPGVIATHYLDTTGQWDRVGVQRREEAIKNIKQGYVQQLVYRKADNSYAAFTNRPASTWLTAYVVKVFSMASKLTHIEADVLCGAVKWLLLDKQTPSGIFLEEAPVIHGEMVGGSGGTEPDASLTAFVLIALAEARETCREHVPSLDGSMKKSADFLVDRLKTLKKPYSVCIVSYALSLVGRLTGHAQLMSLSQGGTHWSDASSQLYMIEASAYALLTLLQLGQYQLSGPVARWLTEQRFYGGGYGSTQATIMVFQAMSQYQANVPLMNHIEMDVTLKLPGRNQPITWRIHTANSMLRRSEMTSNQEKITVLAKGEGQGTLTVMSVYYTPMTERAAPCKNFDFSVSFEDAPGAKKPEGALRSMYINICMRFLGAADSTMTIVDVSMLTGFAPDLEDLNMLTNRVDKYISKYEMDTTHSDRGSLIIYLDKVSVTETECLKFKTHQHFEVGVLQPAAVTVYEYYSLENRCTKFYHPTEEQGEMRRICKETECRCVAENCNLRNRYMKEVDFLERVDAACESGVDYVYECQLVKVEQTGAYDYYTMMINRVVKLGTDEVLRGSERQFLSHRACRDSLKLTPGRLYIVWGHRSDIWDLKADMSYVISGKTWIEEVPRREECDADAFARCEDIEKFINQLMAFGCSH